MKGAAKGRSPGPALPALIREDSIVTAFQAADKWAAIDALIDRLIAAGRIKADERKGVQEALVARENMASTGMEHGVALPHAQVENLAEAAAALGIAPGGVPFQCADGKPATLIALLVIPRRSMGQHVRTLAGIARLLNSPEMRRALLEAETPRAAWEILSRAEAGE
jgi:mannitol/fructose-specific phosphotransferase system IIA component (Ntr-type)